MLADRDVRAILLARGGYGLMRILPRLDVEALRRDPKPIIGFSDAHRAARVGATPRACAACTARWSCSSASLARRRHRAPHRR